MLTIMMMNTTMILQVEMDTMKEMKMTQTIMMMTIDEFI